MQQLISKLIRSFNGYVYISAGFINGFFDDPEQTRICAARIEAQFDRSVTICGCELTVSV